ncbi:hypothetical protein Hanom_Chr12g01151571 [Helianthus anomalus]
MAEVEESNANSEEVSTPAGNASPGISPEFGKTNSQAKGISNGRCESFRSTCMGNNYPINSPYVGVNAGFNNDCDVQEPAENVGGKFNDVRQEKDNVLMEEREARDKAVPTGRISEISEDGCDGENGPDLPRPSFITLRPNQFKPNLNVGVHVYVTPDLNNAGRGKYE